MRTTLSGRAISTCNQQVYRLHADLQCRHLIPALNAWAAWTLYTNAHPNATQFRWHGCIGDHTTKRSFDSQAMWDSRATIDVLGLFFDMLPIGVCTTGHWETSGRLVQELNVCTVLGPTYV